jgi:ferredoxin-type protein NapH
MIYQQMTPNPMALLKFIIWFGFIIIGIILFRRKKDLRRNLLILAVAAFIITGFVVYYASEPVRTWQVIFINPFSIFAYLGLAIFITMNVVFSRAFCGFGCPYGALQEIASKVIKTKNSNVSGPFLKSNSPNIGKIAKIIRAGLFIAMAILALVFVPAIVLFGPLNPFNFFGIFIVGVGIAAVVVFIAFFIASFFVYRPFCRFICPAGCIFDIVSSVSLYRLQRNDNCTDCGICEKACPTGAASELRNKRGKIGSAECYLCGRCITVCPNDALEYTN